MKRSIIFLIPFVFVAGCSNAPRPVAKSDQPVNSAQQTNEARSLLKHGPEESTPKPMNGSGPARGGGDPIDTAEFDEAIAKAQKAGSDDTAKKNLADAYFARGFALTEARQYGAALGDYRRAIKLDPDHEESKKWIDQIEGIYSTMKREAPKEGAEPPPLPFKKGA